MSLRTVHPAPDAEGPRPDHQARRGGSVEAHVPGAPLGVLAVLAVFVGLVLTAFVLPAIHSAPRDVPLGVAGPATVVAQVTGALSAKAPGAFTTSAYTDEAALVQAIKDRDVYGGIAVSAGGPKVLTASGGSPAVAQVLSSLAAGLGAEQGRAVPVTDVVAPPVGDPRGAGLATAVLPLLIGSIAPVAAMRRVVRGPWRRLLGVLSSAVTLGVTLAGLLLWFGVVDSFLLPAAGLSLALAAMSTTLLGLAALAGWPGLGLGASTLLLLGNPLSGIQTAPEFVPAGWSVVGQLLPPGAAGQVLRSDFYFGGVGATRSALVLVAWVGLGLVLVAVGAARAVRTEPTERDAGAARVVETG